jgi:hypothetical protein
MPSEFSQVGKLGTFLVVDDIDYPPPGQMIAAGRRRTFFGAGKTVNVG